MVKSNIDLTWIIPTTAFSFYRPDINIISSPVTILDFFLSYHEFMDNLRKFELQVANWFIYLIYIYYYLYSYKRGTKILWGISSATREIV